MNCRTFTKRKHSVTTTESKTIENKNKFDENSQIILNAYVNLAEAILSETRNSYEKALEKYSKGINTKEQYKIIKEIESALLTQLFDTLTFGELDPTSYIKSMRHKYGICCDKWVFD